MTQQTPRFQKQLISLEALPFDDADVSPNLFCGLIRLNCIMDPEYTKSPAGVSKLVLVCKYPHSFRKDGEWQTRELRVRLTLWRDNADKVLAKSKNVSNKRGQQTVKGARLVALVSDLDLFLFTNNTSGDPDGSIELGADDVRFLAPYMGDGGGQSSNQRGRQYTPPQDQRSSFGQYADEQDHGGNNGDNAKYVEDINDIPF